MARHTGSQATTKGIGLATCAARRDTTRGIAGTGKEHPMEGRPTARDGNGKENRVSEERCGRDPHADSTAVSAVTQDDNWIMMLERAAPQADLSKKKKKTGFEVCAVTLRTAIGQVLESYGRCDIQMQVPSILTPPKVTFEVVDVRHPILSVAGWVANGHRVTFRGQETKLKKSDGAVAPLTRICWLGLAPPKSSFWLKAVQHVTCVRQFMLPW